MKATYANHEITSFVLWLNNRIQNVGQGYQNFSGALYRQADSARSGYTYASPYKSWVYDSAVSGAQIPSGVYTSSQYLTRDSGIVFDFVNGRILSPKNLGATVSTAYSRSEYNIYFSTTSEVNFYLEKAFGENANIPYSPTGAQPYKFVAPCSIVTNAYTMNEAFELGRGLEKTDTTFRIYTISDSNFSQEAVNTLLTDSAHSSIPIVQYSDAPLTFSGDLKGGYYSYAALQATYGCAGIYVKNVYSMKVNDRINQNSTFYISVHEFDLEAIRAPVR